jgi:hypothetical protein
MKDKNRNEISSELSIEAPVLASIPKSNLGRVPHNYFEEVEEQIISQLNLIGIGQEPTMDSVYFDQVEDKILLSLADDNTKVVPLYKKPVFKILAAATTISILSVMAFQLFFQNDKQPEVIFATDIPEVDYYQFIEQNINELDIHLLIEQDLVVESDFNIVSYADSEIPDDTDEYFSESEINF